MTPVRPVMYLVIPFYHGRIRFVKLQDCEVRVRIRSGIGLGLWRRIDKRICISAHDTGNSTLISVTRTDNSNYQLVLQFVYSLDERTVLHSNRKSDTIHTRYHHGFVWTTRVERHLFGLALRFQRNNVTVYLLRKNGSDVTKPLPFSARRSVTT